MSPLQDIILCLNLLQSFLKNFQILILKASSFEIYFFHFQTIDFSLHTVRKVIFLSKNSILTKPQHFHEFLTQFFLTIFLVKSKMSTAKKSKPQHFHEFFTQKNRQFSRKIKVLTIFLMKSKLSTAKKSKTTM